MYKYKMLWIGIIALSMFISCDTLQDDVYPETEASDEYIMTPNSPLLIELADKITADTEKVYVSLQGSRGVATIYSDGYVIYEADATFSSGTDVFALGLDKQNGSTSSIEFVVKMAQDSTVSDSTWVGCTYAANYDYFETSVGTAVEVNALTNDVLCGITPELKHMGDAKHGTVTLSGQNFIYTPAAGYAGFDYFTYSITFGEAADETLSSTVTIQVLQCQVLANDDYYTMGADSTGVDHHIQWNILGNDSFCDRSELTALLTRGSDYQDADAYIDADMYLNYKRSAVAQSDTLVYQICEAQVCDEAYVVIEYN